MSTKVVTTVYIAACNVGRFLGDAVESVLRQSVDDWELIIINDGSFDNTKHILDRYRHDPRVRIYDTGRVGLPAVCNLALEKANGRFLVRLDGDDVFDENILLVLQHALLNDPGLAMVFPDYYLMDEQGRVYAQERRQKLFTNNHMVDMPPNGACTMVRKSVLEEVGGYREDLGVQDGMDLWAKIRGQYKTENINLPLFYYRRHQANLTNDHQRIVSARRTIKRDAILSRLDAYRPLIAVIPCRRYYDFRLDLWSQPLNGCSLLEHKIQVCLSSDILDHIVVACDNPAAEAIVARYGDERLQFRLRDTKNTIRSRSLAFSLQKIAQHLDRENKGLTILSYPANPFATRDALEESIFTLIINEADSSMGVLELRQPLYRRMGHGLTPLNPPPEMSSDFETLYQETRTSMAMRNANLRTGSLTGARIANFVLSEEEALMINSDLSLRIARLIAKGKKWDTAS